MFKRKDGTRKILADSILKFKSAQHPRTFYIKIITWWILQIVEGHFIRMPCFYSIPQAIHSNFSRFSSLFLDTLLRCLLYILYFLCTSMKVHLEPQWLLIANLCLRTFFAKHMVETRNILMWSVLVKTQLTHVPLACNADRRPHALFQRKTLWDDNDFECRKDFELQTAARSLLRPGRTFR